MDENIRNKKIICIWGMPGSGKSNFCTQVAALIAKQYDLKVLVVDFDTLNPSLDHYFGINKMPENISYKINGKEDEKYNTSLNYAFDAIERGIFDTSVLQEIVIEHPLIKNLHIMTGNFLLNIFEMLNVNHFHSILNAAKSIYDVIIIDTNSNIFIDATYSSLCVSDVVCTLTEGDYTSLRNLNNSISYLSSLINKDKFKIVINKHTKHYLDRTTIGQVLEGYEVLGCIDYNDKYIKSKIEKKPFMQNCKKSELETYLRIIKEIVKK